MPCPNMVLDLSKNKKMWHYLILDKGLTPISESTTLKSIQERITLKSIQDILWQGSVYKRL